ncbi:MULTISPECIES: hypothetical protein [Marinobacterium]|uniref:Uncharacterized protein n=1 Tax=Marinobacterium iners DSM 11526 TaxID=1122198 RepID=A0A1H4GPR4_9GAMM|nr:hypothetical protein [Marinobacterium iners]SEB11573.1 hypothetical protein SAMN02745729_1192 [Marinobacterium iners DSM 11526]
MSNISIGSYSNTVTSNQNSSKQNRDRQEDFSSILNDAVNSTSSRVAEVTISDEAKQAASNEFPGWVQEVINRLSNNPDQKEAMDDVKMMATIPGGPLVSIPENFGGTPHYLATGQPVTKESEARFNALAQSITEKTTQIFNSESAKGSSAADIFKKIHEYMATQPEDYLQVLNWYRSSYKY